MATVHDIGEAALDRLDTIPAEQREILKEIRRQVAAAHQDQLAEIRERLNQQTASLTRIQQTLVVLVECLAPRLQDGEKIPVAFALAGDVGAADVAQVMAVADPIGAGYSLSQSDVASVLGINSAHISVLVRALDLNDDESLAVMIRHGKKRDLFNYRRSIIPKLRDLAEVLEENDSAWDAFENPTPSAIRSAIRAIKTTI